jgi:DNA (cytosine-5)-methyltransferase 1
MTAGMTAVRAETDVRQEWETPPDFMAVLKREFRDLCLDVCATPENRKCMYFFAPPGWEGIHDKCRGIDGLIQDWGKLVPCTWFCNPGFGNILPWMTKAAAEAENGASGVLLTHVGVTTQWWRIGMECAAECRLLIPRVQYQPPAGVKASSNARDGALWVFRARRPSLGCHVSTWRWKS